METAVRLAIAVTKAISEWYWVGNEQTLATQTSARRLLFLVTEATSDEVVLGFVVFGVLCAVGVCLTIGASLGRAGVAISVIGVRGLWCMTRLFAQATGGAIGGVYRGIIVSVRWVFGREQSREIVVVGRSLVGDAVVAARTRSQRGVRFNTNTTTIVRGRNIPRSGEMREDE